MNASSKAPEMGRRSHLAVALVLVLAAAPAYAQTQTTHTNDKAPFEDFPATSPCTGETVLLDGSSHLVSTLKVDPDNPERFHFVSTLQVIGQGTSDTGRQYNYGLKSKSNLKGPFGMKVRFTERMISQGSEPPVEGAPGTGDNWFLTTFFVIDKNGNLRRDFGEAECRGGGA